MTVDNNSQLIFWDPLVNVGVAAERLCLKPQTILKHRSLGLPTPRAFTRPGTLRFRTSDIDYFLDVTSGRTPVLRVPHSENLTLRVAEAARYLAMSPTSISTWRSRDKEHAPPGFKIGARVAFRLDDLNEWIERHLEPLDCLRADR